MNTNKYTISSTVTLKEFRSYVFDNLGQDIENLLICSHKRAKEDCREGTLRAAAFACLRMRLPRNWSVEAEVPYPENMGWTNQRADILVYSPQSQPIIIEVKPNDKMDRVVNDLNKIQRHVELKSSKVKYGYVLFGISEDSEDEVHEWENWRNLNGSVQAVIVRLQNL